MKVNFVQDLGLHLKANYPIIFLLSQEEKRALEKVQIAAHDVGKQIVIPRRLGSVAPVAELLKDDIPDDTVIILDDVHRRLEDCDTIRALADLADAAPINRRSVVVLAPWVDIPPELERHCAILELPLPTPDELRETLDNVCVEAGVLQTDEDATRLVRAAQGLTEDEAARAFSKAMLGWPEEADKALASVINDKRRSLRRSQVLESVDTPNDLDNVGGLDRLKQWLTSRNDAFTQQARRFGLPAPKGLLLMGVQGCGKSLTSKAVAGHWKLPLIRLDLSAVFGSERPEEALRRSLKIAEAMAPVVLWIDEIEKGFDQGGRGPSARILGGMVTWLQEKIGEVFVVATANNVSNLPPELPRKGRFDEIFFVDLPNYQERCAILSLHLKKRGRNPENFSVDSLAKRAEKLTGSELEQLIIAAMYSAFSRKQDLTDNDLMYALKETVPLYDTFESEIKKLREWARKRARPASTDRKKIDMFAENSQGSI